ncbi:MAG: GTP-sensing pleiotropic transcriptional regulator CodY [Streptococcaceae bacterium]|nr:GTP-sensing pleiotropic transcriptional regulator CodY [Streptococcaceae bacterium]
MQTLLEKTRKINDLLQKQSLLSDTNDLPYDKIATILGDIINANTFIIGIDGVLLGYHERKRFEIHRVDEMIHDRRFPDSYTEELKILHRTETNIPVTDKLTAFPEELRQVLPNGLTTISPIYVAGKRLGSFVLGREKTFFEDDDLVLIEYSSMVVGQHMFSQDSRKKEKEIRDKTALNMAMNSLSHSEIRAVRAILDALNGMEGTLTASEIADRENITRSVIVNALRKLSSAGILTSKSLGMKGTWVKVLNDGIFSELEKSYY